MTKRKDFWPFLVFWFLLTVSLLALGFFWAQREGLWVVSALVAVGAFTLVKNWLPSHFRHATQFEVRGLDSWGFRERILRLVEAYNLSSLAGLKVCILPQAQSLALACGLRGRDPLIVVSEGLLRSLDAQEQQALASLLVATTEVQQRWSSSVLLTACLSWLPKLPNRLMMRWVHRDADKQALLRGADRAQLGHLLWRLSQNPKSHAPFLPERVIDFRSRELILSPLIFNRRIDQRLRDLVGYYPI